MLTIQGHQNLKKYSTGKRIEKFLFFIISALNIIPVLSGKYFTTLDGPSHLYSVNILDQIWFHTTTISKYFTINPVPVPNWLGHFLLLLLHLFLPAFLAEKILILGYFFGIAYSFRWIVRSIEPEAQWSTFLIFPFTYGFLLTLRFYNYYISFILLFLALGYWINHSKALKLKVISEFVPVNKCFK